MSDLGTIRDQLSSVENENAATLGTPEPNEEIEGVHCNCGVKLAGYVLHEDEDGGYTCWHVADFAGPHVFADSRSDALCWATDFHVPPDHDVLAPDGELLSPGACRDDVEGDASALAPGTSDDALA